MDGFLVPQSLLQTTKGTLRAEHESVRKKRSDTNRVFPGLSSLSLRHGDFAHVFKLHEFPDPPFAPARGLELDSETTPSLTGRCDDWLIRQS